ncbi:MAG: IS110 family transposase [Solirubrobacteraceae bacterium]
MPDVSSTQPADVRLWVALDVHKLSIVAAILPPQGGAPEVQQIETTRAAIRRFIDRLGGPEGLAVSYEAGPGGFDLLRLLSELGVACDVIAPSLIPVRAGDRIKTDRRDATKLVRLYRGGQLSFVAPPTPETEGLRDLMRCRDDLRCARTAARHRVSKQLLRHGRIYRDGKSQWTKMRRAWIARQRLDDTLAHRALEEMLTHLDGLDRQLDALDRELELIARGERWANTVEILTRFKGVSTRTALGLIAEIGDFTRFGHPRELCAWLGIVPSEYSSGQQCHRGHITKTGNHHARRLLVEAAWSCQHRPRRPDRGPDPTRAPGRRRSGCTRATGTSPPNAGNAPPSRPIARELTCFLWAAVTDQPFVTEKPVLLEAAAA